MDIDHVLRKEVDLDCITPSNPIPILHGQTQNIHETLQKVFGNDCFQDIYGPELPSIAEVSKLYTPNAKWKQKSEALETIENSAIERIVGNHTNDRSKRRQERISRTQSTMKRLT